MSDKMRFYRWPEMPDRWVPSVTTVASVLAKPGLDRWKQEQAILAAFPDIMEWGEQQASWDPNPESSTEFYDAHLAEWLKEADRLAEEARQIGTEVHDMLAQFHRDQVGVTNNPLVGLLVASYMSEWFTPTVEKVMDVERVVYGEIYGLRFAGTLDLHAWLKPGGIVDMNKRRTLTLPISSNAIIDIKASKAIYPEYGVQLGGYNVGLGVSVGHLLTVRLDKQDYHVHVKSWDPSLCRAMFTHALELWYGLHPDSCERYGRKMEKEHDRAESDHPGGLHSDSHELE